MNPNERGQGNAQGKERLGPILKWGGVIGALLGLLAENAALVLGGAGLAAGGIIFEGRKNKSKPQAA